MGSEGQDRTGQVWKGQVGLGQVGIGQVRIGQVGAGQVGTSQVGKFYVRKVQIGWNLKNLELECGPAQPDLFLFSLLHSWGINEVETEYLMLHFFKSFLKLPTLKDR